MGYGNQIVPADGSVTATKMGFTRAVVVEPTDDLAAVYAWLKSADRDAAWGAASAANRRVLLLTPGTYTLTDTLTLDADYCDIVALAPSDGRQMTAADTEKGTTGGAGSLCSRPPGTVVTHALSKAVVTQSANNVQLFGFGIVNLTPVDWTTTPNGVYGFLITATDNSASRYTRMYFHLQYSYDNVGIANRATVYSTGHMAGIWRNCIATSYAWRVAPNKNLSATMYDCLAGPFSFGGDATGVDSSGRFERCESHGKHDIIGTNYGSGVGSFGGCTMYGSNCSGTFIECVAGWGSFALGATFSGRAIRCRSGPASFGCYGFSADKPGKFTGYAEDCVGGAGSFGGIASEKVNSESTATLQGTLIRCRIGRPYQSEGIVCAGWMWLLAGAYLEDCVLQGHDTAYDEEDLVYTLVLCDSNCALFNCTITTGSADTLAIATVAYGYQPVARNAKIAHCRLGGVGIEADVTNLVSNPANVVDADVTVSAVTYP